MGFPAVIQLSDLDGSTGFTVDSARDAAHAGDVNSDGIDDMVIGRSVVFGQSDGFGSALALSSLDGATGFTLSGGGYDVAGDVDINGDGIDDVIFSTDSFSRHYGGPSATFVVFGHSGSFTATLEVSDLDGQNGFVIQTGGSVSGAADINGDGFDDIVIGIYDGRTLDYPTRPTGVADGYVIFGRPGRRQSWIRIRSTAAMALSSTHPMDMVAPWPWRAAGTSMVTAWPTW